ASLEEVVARPDRFDPATSSRRCVLVTADDAMATVLPSFAATVLRKAPGMTLEIRPRIVPMVDELEAESVDLVIQLERELPSWAGSVQLYRDGLVCVVREGHPDVGDALTLEQFCRLPHVRISPEGFGASGLDRMLEAMGVERRIAVYAFSFAMAPEIVMRTDAVLTMPIRQARVIAPRLGLRLVEPPFEMPWFATQLVWHRGRDDSALAWLREQLVESAQADMERDTV
ncbi:MAG: LysR substrate-binding domain-containing protein, partial [Myxococcota bacterium]